MRLHVLSPRGRPFRAKGTPAGQDYMHVPGTIVLTLVPGRYQFTAERGPEYKDVRGSFEVQPGASDNQTILMERIVDMSDLGWWSSDLLTRRPVNDLMEAMRAEDLDIACNFHEDSLADSAGDTKETATPRVIGGSNQLIRSDGGRLAFLESPRQKVPGSKFQMAPNTGAQLVAARRAGARHLAAVDAAAWDLPMWLASQRLDSVMVFGPALLRQSSDPPRAGWRAPDDARFAGPRGTGQWSEAVYFNLLNSGFRMPPTAGSGSGFNANPVGYNRVYVHLREGFQLEAWWQSLAAGRVLITNGPLLVPKVNGEFPGHVFRAPAGQTIALHPVLTLYTRETIDYLEFIKDGRIVQSVPLERWRADNGQLPPIPFEQSGWLIIRAVANNNKTYRAVMTGPYYVQIGDERPIQRESAQFFADWCVARARQVAKNTEANRDALRFHRAANAFWQQRLEESK